MLPRRRLNIDRGQLQSNRSYKKITLEELRQEINHREGRKSNEHRQGIELHSEIPRRGEFEERCGYFRSTVEDQMNNAEHGEKVNRPNQREKQIEEIVEQPIRSGTEMLNVVSASRTRKGS